MYDAASRAVGASEPDTRALWPNTQAVRVPERKRNSGWSDQTGALEVVEDDCG